MGRAGHRQAPHHAVVVGVEGEKLHSQRVVSDEPALLILIAYVGALAGEVVWAIDLRSSELALLVILLLAHGEQVVYVPGMTVNRAAGSYRGAGKTDAKDAFIVADQARMRRDLTAVHADVELIVELQMLVAHRRDVAADRTGRSTGCVIGCWPSARPGGVLDLGNRGPLVLLTGFGTAAALRGAGVEGVTAWLGDHRTRGAATLAASAVGASQPQNTSVPGEALAARLVAGLALALTAATTSRPPSRTSSHGPSSRCRTSRAGRRCGAAS